MRNWKTPLFFVLAVLAVCLASYFAGRVRGHQTGWEAGYEEGFSAPHPADTITRTDTFYFDRPVPVERVVVRHDTLAVVDTLNLTDTLFVEVPIEKVMYEDSTYRAQVSGWHPSLDWVEVYQRTQTINNYIVQPTPYDWTISAVAGVDAQQGLYRARAGVLYDRRITGGLRWSAEAGYQAGNLGRGIYGEVRLRLDMLHSH